MEGVTQQGISLPISLDFPAGRGPRPLLLGECLASPDRREMAEALVFAVIDDDPAVRRLFGTIIERSGDVVVQAGSRAEGEVVIREYPWDVALIDRRLADGDGLDLCRLASTHDGESHRQVIIVSGSSEHDERLRGFEAGADDCIGKPVDPLELRARLTAVRRNVLAQKALLARVALLEQLSVIDGLTQVYNHRYFETELRRRFDLALRYSRPLALAMADIDHFKAINDAYGHRAGDVVLTEVSTAIAQTVRSSDVLARYGGEEFAVILPETTLADAAIVTARLREAVEALTVRDSFGEVRVTISIGVAALPHPDLISPSRVVEAADAALYLAKSRGRNRVELHAPVFAAAPAAAAGVLLQ